MRMLNDWPFWRGLVTIGSAFTMCILILIFQPFYTLKGNLYHGLLFVFFGVTRLFNEIAEGIDLDGKHDVTRITLIIIGIVMSFVLAVFYGLCLKKRRCKFWLLADDMKQLPFEKSENNCKTQKSVCNADEAKDKSEINTEQNIEL